MWVKRISVLIISLTLLTLFISCSKKQQMQEEIIRPVRYAKVYVTGGSRLRTFSGTAQAGLESTLSFKVAGTVESVPVSVGDKVNKGQLLAKIDDNDYRLQVQEAEASLAQAQAGLRNAKADYERIMSLYESRSTTKQALDGSRANFESSKAMVESIEKRLELARLQVSYTKLIAPVSGSIAQVNIDVNENVSQGMPIIILTSGSHPEVSVSVPEVLISQIRSQSPATVKFDAIPDKTFKATVIEVGVASTAFATTFPVKVKLNSENSDIRPGMAAEVSFKFETTSTIEKLIVPTVSVGEDRDGRFVYVLEPSEEGFALTRKRTVKVGELTSEGMEIIEGVQEGELVVTAGISKITDGQKVKLI